MKRLYSLNEELKNKRNFIYGVTMHTMIVGAAYIREGMNFDGFVTLDTGEEKEVLGKSVLSLEEFLKEDANILLVDSNWQEIYVQLYKCIDSNKIYIDTTWIPTNDICMICGNRHMFAGMAMFVPFLKERMFQGKDQETWMMFCPKCGMYYSSYRPTDEEMDRLYSGYRNEEYQKQRQKYEPGYTKEANESLYHPADNGKSRMDNMVEFLEGLVDFSSCKSVLDWGGDKGQFIPPVFSHTYKCVFEVSGTDTIEGVALVTDKEQLRDKKWDMIFCNMVLEHVSDVPGTFAKILEFMSENTKLYIEVPYEHTMANSEFSVVHEHMNFFSEESFYELAKRNSVHVLKCRIKGDVLQCCITL